MLHYSFRSWFYRQHPTILSRRLNQKGTDCRRGAAEGNFAIAKWFLPLPDQWFKITNVIPASFAIQLKRGDSNLELKQQRKLLNTEKLIFESGDVKLLSEQGGTFVLVTVEPEGVVAIPHVQEREEIIYNIVCDELLLGIPHKAWWVVILVVICLGLAAVVPYFIPSYLLQKDPSPQLIKDITSKDS